MTDAPTDLINVRKYLLAALDLVPGVARDADLDPDEVGIVGDPAHAATGGYHEGNDDLARVGRLTTDYSKRESPRDRPGTDSASALDLGEFDVTLAGRHFTLRSVSAALVDACRRGDPRTRDIREVIWSPDGVTVQRWDRLGIRAAGDSSHTWHTHLSFHRDSEGRRDRADNVLGLLKEIIEGDDVALSDDDLRKIVENVTCGLRRGAWRDGYLDATLDVGYRGGPTLGSLASTLDQLAAKVDALAHPQALDYDQLAHAILRAAAESPAL